MSNLTQEFQKFVGKTVKHPDRLTCDMCDTTEALRELALSQNMSLAFYKAGQPLANVVTMLGSDLAIVDLEENADKKLVIKDIYKP